jgi:hypothetical protein
VAPMVISLAEALRNSPPRSEIIEGIAALRGVQTKLAPFLLIDRLIRHRLREGSDEPDKLRLKSLDQIPKNLRLAITRLKFDK